MPFVLLPSEAQHQDLYREWLMRKLVVAGLTKAWLAAQPSRSLAFWFLWVPSRCECSTWWLPDIRSLSYLALLGPVVVSECDKRSTFGRGCELTAQASGKG